MGTKNRPGEFDCYDAAGPDEPMFIVLARDESAPELVEDWATKRFRRLMQQYFTGPAPTPEEELRVHRKIAEAFMCAIAMRQWRSTEKDRERQQEEARAPAYAPVCTGSCYTRGCNCAPGHETPALVPLTSAALAAAREIGEDNSNDRGC